MAATAASRLVPEDAFRHQLPDHPDAREAMYWNVLLPEAELGLALYATMKASGATTQVALAYGADLQPIVVDVAEAPFEGKDLDDFRVGGLSVRQPKPMHAWEVSYQGDRLTVELSYEAITEAFDYWQNPNGSPQAFTSHNRIEQSGRIEGRFTLDGREIPFRTTGHHDHSWGIRDWGSMLHYKWIGAQAGPDIAVHAAQVIWRGQVCVNGYVLRDGQMSPLVGGRFDGTYEADVHTRTVDLELVDAAGRTTRATGERFAGTRFPFPGVMLTETACTFEIEGRQGVGVVEMLFPEGYMDHVAGNWAHLAGT